MRLEAAIKGDLEKIMKEESAAAEKAVTLGVGDAGSGLKDELRGQVSRSGLGDRMAKTWKFKRYPSSGYSLGAAALVYADMPQVIRAFNEGSLIKSDKGFFLAIPTPAAPKRGVGGKRINPSNFPEHSLGRLRFVYRRTGPSLLVAEGRLNTKGQAVVSRSKTGRGKVTAPIFLLVPQVKLPKRLDLARDADRALDSVPGLIVANWAEVRF